MHHAVLLSKPRILEALERYKNEALNEKREKKRQWRRHRGGVDGSTTTLESSEQASMQELKNEASTSVCMNKEGVLA